MSTGLFNLFEHNNPDQECCRQYATAAFRLYARLGKPTGEDIHTAIFEKALESSKNDLAGIKGGTPNPTEHAYINAERLTEQAEGIIKAVRAVESTLNIVSSRENGRDIIMALENVYFHEPEKPLGKREIINRVNFAALLINCSDRQVFRLLRTARDVFILERGLRLSF